MLDAPVRRALEVKIQKAQVLFVALLSSLVVYLVVCYLLAAQGEPPVTGAAIEVLKPALGTLAFFSLIASFALRARLLRKAIAGLPARPTRTDEAMAEAVIRAAMTPWILGWALCESVAIYGMILFLMTFQWELFLPFWGIGLAAMLAQAPSLRSLEEALRPR
jgi:hypothetical protein